MALLGIGAGVLATPALALDCPELVGGLPGSIGAVAVEGDYAHFGSGTELMIADISNPAAQQVVMASIPERRPL